MDENVPINTTSAYKLSTNYLIFFTVRVFGITLAVDQLITIHAGSTSVVVIFAAVLDHTDIVFEDKGRHTFITSLRTVLLAAKYLALSIDGKLERRGTLGALGGS